MEAPESSRSRGRMKGLFNVSCMSVSLAHHRSDRCGRCKVVIAAVGAGRTHDACCWMLEQMGVPLHRRPTSTDSFSGSCSKNRAARSCALPSAFGSSESDQI